MRKNLKPVNFKIAVNQRKILGVGAVIVVVLFILSLLPTIIETVGKTIKVDSNQSNRLINSLLPVTTLAGELLTPTFYLLVGYVGFIFFTIPALKIIGFLFIGMAFISLYSVIQGYLGKNK